MTASPPAPSENPVDIVVEALKEAKEQRSLSLARIARETGLHSNTLADFGKIGWNPSLYTIRRLSDYLLSGVTCRVRQRKKRSSAKQH